MAIHLENNIDYRAWTRLCRGFEPEWIKTRCVIWAGEIKAPELAGATGLPQGLAGRIDLQAHHSVKDAPCVYALGDFANIPVGDGA